MLSRIAEALFWIGRYVERADALARLLDVYLQLLVEDPVIDREATCRSIFAAMGAQHDGVNDPDAVLRVLLWDSTSPSSIAFALETARENARRSREVVSTELWEGLNTTYYMVSNCQLSGPRPADGFRLVRERANLITALADQTQSHDDGWQFIVLGRSIERIDMTSRMIQMTTYATAPSASWLLTLRACGGAHAFTRTYRAIESPRAAAEFLLQDRLFPRSIAYSLGQAAACLEVLDPRQRRVGFGGDAARIIGRARARMDYLSLTELLSDLAGEMSALQSMCGEATEAVAHRYFEGAVAPEWLGGPL
ncbi:alpha-E domain-containing protein [Calidifontibacter sp. DB0510]|uniref:Alpha-E domain-containing protein n=1 Tax=Metallococcus carri TaxID=1656884 RepID=A0A967B481_9MICO|nr:alpha-E domain-containing protein [Metallococcus carri]NHN55332.1 alpha-E domain-containing protein [Metallococcus carri]NOP36409.1 alpha-E domain-containing protein [Calidifontibacter sp. DB2511S]